MSHKTRIKPQHPPTIQRPPPPPPPPPPKRLLREGVQSTYTDDRHNLDESNNQTTLDHLVLEAFNIALFYDPAPLPILVMKVSEELGELSEAVSRDLGYMSHKTDEYEDSMYEAADIIIALAALIVNHNNELHHKSPIETLAELKRAIAKKTRKYATAMGCAQ